MLWEVCHETPKTSHTDWRIDIEAQSQSIPRLTLERSLRFPGESDEAFRVERNESELSPIGLLRPAWPMNASSTTSLMTPSHS